MWITLTLGAIAALGWPERPTIRLMVLPYGEKSASERRTLSPQTRRAWLISVAILAVSALFAPGLLEFAIPAAIAAGLWSRKLAIKPSAEIRSADRRQLTVICDLVATCLSAGMPTGAALTAVLDQVVPASSEKEFAASVTALRAVAALLALGAEPGRAWESADRVAELAPIAAAARRSTVGGVGLAQAVRDQATVLGLQVADDLERRAGRAGVLMAAPLGLCFLPAFICLGLAPVIIALLADLGIG